MNGMKVMYLNRISAEKAENLTDKLTTADNIHLEIKAYTLVKGKW